MIYNLETYSYNGFIIPMEFWRPITQEMIPNIKPIYWVSNIGNIYNQESGAYFTRNNISPDRYIRLSFKSINGGLIYESLHRIVCMAFNGMPTEERNVVDHINCDRSCNYEGNVEWVSPGENNARTRERNRSNSIGEECYRAILTNSEVEDICQMLSEGIPIKDIETIISERIKPRVYPALYSGIHSILGRECWKEISNKYTFYDYNRAILNLDEVEVVCQCLEKGMRYIDIVKHLNRYGTEYENERLCSAISFIKNGYHYKEISSKYNISKEKKRTLTEDEVEFVCKGIAMNMPPQEILSIMERGQERAVRAAVFDINRGACYKSKVEYYKNNLPK